MTQLTIELDGDTARKVADAAAAAHMATGEWVAALVRARTTGGIDPSWPAAVRDLAGAWPDFPEAEELRAGPAADGVREAW